MGGGHGELSMTLWYTLLFNLKPHNTSTHCLHVTTQFIKPGLNAPRPSDTSVPSISLSLPPLEEFTSFCSYIDGSGHIPIQPHSAPGQGSHAPSIKALTQELVKASAHLSLTST